MSSKELYPGEAAAKWEQLTWEEELVCKLLKSWSGDAWGALKSVTWEGGDHADNHVKQFEIDAFYEMLRGERILGGFAVMVESLPPVLFFEDDFSVASAIDAVRRELPFNDTERRQAATLGLQWDERDEWLRPLTDEEAGLVEHWHGWIRDPQPNGSLPLSASAARAKQTLSNLNESFYGLLPERLL